MGAFEALLSDFFFDFLKFESVPLASMSEPRDDDVDFEDDDLNQ